MSKEFYVYVHLYASGPKEGKPFYVGKGSGDRYRFFHKRNKHWNNTCKKYGVKCKIIKRFANESCAYTFESILIKHIGLDKLCNYSVGGYGGCKGYRWTKEQRDRHPNAGINPESHHNYDSTEYEFLSPSGDLVVMTKYNLCMKYRLKQASINLMVSGDVSSVFGWTIKGYRQTWRRRYYSEVVKFNHPKLGDFIGTRKSFLEQHSVPSSKSAELMRGSRLSCKGWKFVEIVK